LRGTETVGMKITHCVSWLAYFATQNSLMCRCQPDDALCC
jgi:hypothetical protein